MDILMISNMYNPPLLLISFLFLLLPLSFIFSTNLRRRRRLSPPPTTAAATFGPPSYPIIGCLISFYKNRTRLLDWYTDLLSLSPTQTISVDRVGAGRIVVTANPDNVEYILKTNFSNFPKGKPLTELIGDLLGCGIFNADGELWARQRKIASHEFSTRSLREFVVSVLEEEVRSRLVPLLGEAADEGRVVDLQDVMTRLTYDAICKVSLGTDPNCLDLSRPPPPLLHSFELAAAICARRSAAPLYLSWKLKRFFNLGSERDLRSAVDTVHRSINHIIAEKQHHSSDPGAGGDLLSRLISAGHSGDIVRDMLVSFIMAGRDTTASAMTWLFWLLSQNRDVEEELLDEAMRFGGEDGSRRPLDYEALKEMKFSHACLCESMRLYPPVAWDSKHSERDDVLPDGTRVFAGTRVTFFPYGMGRMEKLWGKDRLEFRPRRWFEEKAAAAAPAEPSSSSSSSCSDGGGRGGNASENEKGLRSVSPYVYPVFQAGPRICLGKEMAFLQMKYVVASLVKRFEFVPISEEKPVFVPLLTAHMMGGFKVRVKRRRDVKCHGVQNRTVSTSE